MSPCVVYELPDHGLLVVHRTKAARMTVGGFHPEEGEDLDRVIAQLRELAAVLDGVRSRLEAQA